MMWNQINSINDLIQQAFSCSNNRSKKGGTFSNSLSWNEGSVIISFVYFTLGAYCIGSSSCMFLAKARLGVEGLCGRTNGIDSTFYDSKF